MATREHLFRAKNAGGEGWIYGIPLDDEIIRNVEGFVVGVKIKPETVCEYTGLTDKNGTQIFEGDIVNAFKHNETPFIFPITFRAGCFWYGNWNFIEFLDKFRNTEVIGNIFDNPELIGGEQK